MYLSIWNLFLSTSETFVIICESDWLILTAINPVAAVASINNDKSHGSVGLSWTYKFMRSRAFGQCYTYWNILKPHVFTYLELNYPLFFECQPSKTRKTRVIWVPGIQYWFILYTSNLAPLQELADAWHDIEMAGKFHVEHVKLLEIPTRWILTTYVQLQLFDIICIVYIYIYTVYIYINMIIYTL